MPPRPHANLTPWLLAAALLCLLTSRAHAAKGCDCSSIRLSPTDVPVRDSEGVTYANTCLAQCQGAKGIVPTGGSVGVASGGATSRTAAGPFNPKMMDTRTPLRPADFHRFKSEGFKLVARMRKVPGKAWVPQLAKTTGAAGAAAAGSTGAVAAARMTAEGLLYLLPQSSVGQAAAAAAASGGAEFVPGFRGTLPSPAPANRTGGSPGSRKMLVVGTDDRWEITSSNGAHSYPYRAIGNLVSGCSAALIGPSTLLTAGHCVYDTTSRTFYENYNYISARHDGGTHCNKYSSRGSCTQWEYEREVAATWATTWFNNAGSPVKCKDGTWRCQTKKDFAFDIAVIRLAEREGDRKGWLGYGYSCSSLRYSVNTAGYPSDLTEDQSRMWAASGRLAAFSGCWGRTDVRGVVSSNLDTAAGQSGSAIWDSKYTVRAVHVSGGPGHRTIVKDYFNWIKKNNPK